MPDEFNEEKKFSEFKIHKIPSSTPQTIGHTDVTYFKKYMSPDNLSVTKFRSLVEERGTCVRLLAVSSENYTTGFITINKEDLEGLVEVLKPVFNIDKKL